MLERIEKPRERDEIKCCINLELAWLILDEYDCNEDQLVETLIKDIEDLNCYEDRGKLNLYKMEKFAESLSNFTSQMSALDKTDDLNGRILVSHIRRRLPERHRVEYLKDISDVESDSVSTLVSWLRKRVILLKKAETSDCKVTNKYKIK